MKVGARWVYEVGILVDTSNGQYANTYSTSGGLHCISQTYYSKVFICKFYLTEKENNVLDAAISRQCSYFSQNYYNAHTIIRENRIPCSQFYSHYIMFRDMLPSKSLLLSKIFLPYKLYAQISQLQESINYPISSSTNSLQFS